MATKNSKHSALDNKNWAKTQSCNYFNTCGCRYGDKCWFNHKINPCSVNHVLFSQLIKLNNTMSQQQKTIQQVNNTLSEQQKTIKQLNTSIKHLKQTQVTNEQLKHTLEISSKQNCKVIKDQNKQQVNILKGLVNKEVAQIKQNQDKQQKTMKAQKDIMSSFQKTLQSIEAQRITLEQSLKQINNKINEKAKQFEDSINFARNDIIEIHNNNNKMESKTLEKTLESKLDQMLMCCTKSNEQSTLEEISTQTENTTDRQQAIKNILSSVDCVVADIGSIRLVPSNYECEILEIIDEHYDMKTVGEFVKAKVNCNGVISNVLVGSDYIVEKGEKLKNGIWEDEHFYKELTFVKFKEDSHCVIDIDNDVYENVNENNLDDNDNEEKTVEINENEIDDSKTKQ
eukprot:322330_1